MRTRSVRKREQVPESVHRVVGSRGHSLDPRTRTHLESRLGRSLSGVQIHTDAAAAASARAIDATAYTVGDHVVFGEGRYRPDTLPGLALLTHEATHVAQQPAGTPVAVPTRLAEPHEASEVEAHRAAASVVHGGDAHPVNRAEPSTVHRHKDDLVAYGGGQSGALVVIAAGKILHIASSVSGHVGSGEDVKGAGPIPAGWYTLHPGITNKPVTTRQGGVCGASAISQGYQEITNEDKVPCAAGSAHYCNVPCPTVANPDQKCWTPKDCWGPKRIRIEGSARVKVPPPGRGTVTRDGFFIHGGNPADAVSSGCVKAMDNDVFDHIRTLTGVKGAVPLCVGSACGEAVRTALLNSLPAFLGDVLRADSP
jgi:hypothetical protein